MAWGSQKSIQGSQRPATIISVIDKMWTNIYLQRVTTGVSYSFSSGEYYE